MDIIARTEWDMPGPLGPAKVQTPAQRLWLHHTAGNCTATASNVRAVAQTGVDRFGRASYSWVVTTDGRVWEMQGDWIGAHTAGHNSSSFGVALVCNHEHKLVTKAQVEAVAALYRWLRTTGRLAAGAPLLPHSAASATACPGRHGRQALPEIWALAQLPPIWVDLAPEPGGTATVELPILAKGDEGGAVVSLQVLLNRKAGQGLRVDGDFGPATQRAVRNVQAFFKLTVDGVVGSATWPTLFL